MAQTFTPSSAPTQSMTTAQYTTPPTIQRGPDKIIFNDLGFRNPIPVDLDVHTVGQYFGSNESWLGVPRKMYYSHQPEYFTRGGYLPTMNGRPLINPYLPIYNFSREDFAEDVQNNPLEMSRF